MLSLLPWLLVLQFVGLAALPWGFPFLKSLPDRGYGVSKALGLLILVYAYWALVTAGLFSNGILSLLLVLGLYLTASFILARQQWPELHLFLRYRWRLLALEEGIFLVALISFAAFRVFVPDITVTTTLTGVTTEQPMDLAFLTSALRSTTFPIDDPWLAGHSVSYYYLGYLIFSLPARLVNTASFIAYNLSLATVFAMAAVGAFSLAMNAVSLSGFARTAARRLTLFPFLGGLVALLLLLVSGNLAGGLQGIRRLVFGLDGGLFANAYWWWDSTRIIHDGTSADPINEVPAFSFILGDLHPHLMALPFVLLALTLTLGWLARADLPDVRWPLRQPGELLLLALAIGALGFINTWDLPTYFGILVGAIVVRRLWDYSDVPDRTWSVLARDILSPAVAILVLALALYLPFYLSLDVGVKAVLPTALSGTGPQHYLLIWGPMLAAVPPVLLAAWARVRGDAVPRLSLLVALLLALAPLVLWLIVVTLWAALSTEVGDAAPPRPMEVLQRSLLVAAPLGIAVAALIALLPSRWEVREQPGRVFAYLLVLAGVAAVLLPELFFVRDLFGTRMNTVFKLHYQAWLLLSIAAAMGLVWLLARPWPRSPAPQVAAVGTLVASMLLIGASLAYGPLAAATRIQASPGPDLALDGLSAYRETFPDEAEAVEWLRRNATRNAVVLEAVGGDYSDFARVSILTGIPTVLGWEGHELQWHSGPTPYLGRREAVASIYAASDPREIARLLAFYDVDYIFVGRLERQEYGLDVADRLMAALPGASEVHRSGDVIILSVPDFG